MTPSKPYVVKAFYDWILDNHCTPYLLVDASYPGVKVPQNYVSENNQIVLNINPSAVESLVIGIQKNNPSSAKNLRFNASFGGVLNYLIVPYPAILAIYAKENGEGMMFEAEESFEDLEN
ncbi:MAG: stringent starvation protein B, partial [Gammaproteobacteria bacterium]